MMMMIKIIIIIIIITIIIIIIIVLVVINQLTLPIINQCVTSKANFLLFDGALL